MDDQPFYPQDQQFDPRAYARGGTDAKMMQLMLRQFGAPHWAGLMQDPDKFDAVKEAMLQVYGVPRGRTAPPLFQGPNLPEIIAEKNWNPIFDTSVQHGGNQRMGALMRQIRGN